MKAYIKPKEFSKFTFEITIESQKEAEFFYNLFNWNPICHYVESKVQSGFSDHLRKILRISCPEVEKFSSWHEFVDFLKNKGLDNLSKRRK